MQPKPVERRRARVLRAAGMPYKRIAVMLGVSVNSVYRWTRDVELTAEQKRANLYGPNGPQSPERVRGRMKARTEKCRARRALYQEEGRIAARRGDRLHHAGCMLYWAEGGKGPNAIEFTNSDARMLVLFRRFLTDSLGVEPACILLSINVYTGNGLTIEQIERHWLNRLELPPSSARKHTVDHTPTSSSGRARNKLPYGVCTLRVHSTWKLQHVYGAIQEYGGFDEPAWLR